MRAWRAQRPHWRIALKNGWYPTTAGGWRVNSAGLISDDRGEPRYVIAVLTAGQPDLDYGIATIEEITRQIYAALGRRPSAGGAPLDRRRAGHGPLPARCSPLTAAAALALAA